MVISREAVEARIADLSKREQALRADLNAVIGALQDCGYWRAQLEKVDADDLPEAPTARDQADPG